MVSAAALPAGVQVFERGWLSANNVLCTGPGGSALVDSGYATHAAQTVALAEAALGARPLDRLLNTHLHSDHCGCNAALQAHWPSVATAVPPGEAAAAIAWDEAALSYRATGQQCPRFRVDALLQPGRSERLGLQDWEVHAAPGHDPHAVLLYEPVSRTLIAGDALWADGFGVVFPELVGEPAFDEVAATLDVIERLAPRTAIPGHGAVFTAVPHALAAARRRLDAFQRDPQRHRQYAAKVLLKFKLLEWQAQPWDAVAGWAASTPYLLQLHRQLGAGAPLAGWLRGLADQLVASSAARWDGNALANA